MLHAELRDEVLVAVSGLGAEGGEVVGEVVVGWVGVVREVHVAGVPLGAEGGDGEDAPVEEDAELGVAEPVGDAVGGEGVPIGAEGAGGGGGFDGGEDAGALRGKGGGGGDPLAIELLGREGGGCGGCGNSGALSVAKWSEFPTH